MAGSSGRNLGVTYEQNIVCCGWHNKKGIDYKGVYFSSQLCVAWSYLQRRALRSDTELLSFYALFQGHGFIHSSTRGPKFIIF